MPEENRTTTAGNDGPPDPHDRRKIAATALLIAVLATVTLFLTALALTGVAGTLTGERGIGRFFLLILDSKIDAKILTGITAVIGIGSAFVAGGALSNRIFYSIVTLCGLSIALALVLWVLLSDDLTARNFYNFASERLADAESFRNAVHWVLGGTTLWLLGVLGTQVGLRSKD